MFSLSLFGITAGAMLFGSMLGIALAAVGLAILQFKLGGNFSPLSNATWNIFNSFTLTAVPMFILLGELMGQTGLARRIYSALAPLFARLPGGLMQTNIGICTAFAAISGSSTATSAVVGAIAYDEMVERGYPPKALAGSIAAGGTLGILIPPSIPMIIYGSMTDVSVGALFIAGVIPGLLLAALFMLYIGISAVRNRDVPVMERISWGAALRGSVHAWPFLALVMAILGTMFLGLATPTEAAALGVLAVLILALLYGELTWTRWWSALTTTTMVYSALALIIIGAVILGQAVALTGLPKYLLVTLQAAALSKWVVLALVYGLYIVLGMFFGPLEMMLITLPFTFPLVTGLGFDPVWFGVVLVILIEIGLLTPPVGINLFVVMSIAKNKLSLGDAGIAALPYVILMLLLLLAITLMPDVVLWLPRVLM
ncbi:MAG: TRAP transporter large permease [Ramlibacter sp.]